MDMTNEATSQPASHNQLLSHGMAPWNGLGDRLQFIKSRIRQAGDLPGVTVNQQISLLEELSTFELGRFLLENRGLDAYWTHQLVTCPQGTPSLLSISSLEYRIWEKVPMVLATRERFGIFRQQAQALLRPGIILASVPCGFMGEVLMLDYNRESDITLIGIDLDQCALNGAVALAKERGLADKLLLHCEDAWTFTLNNETDILMSNGLNIYEPDDIRIRTLYRSFFNGLKPGGTLITSFLTPPPALSAESPWNIAEIDAESLALQHLLFVRIIEAKCSAFRTHAQTIAQLEHAGFVNIRFIDDRARMFPTVIAWRPPGYCKP